MNNKPALTLIELVIVMALVAILSGVAVINFRKMRENQAMKLSSENIVSELNRVRIFSRENRNEKSWGLKVVSESAYTIKVRDESGVSDLASYELSSPVLFADANFEVWFDQVTGNTGEDKRLQLRTPSGSVKNINISQYGVINIE
jgi:prepilin-type N-terminal cleavage/methylation domain-containing protein